MHRTKNVLNVRPRPRARMTEGQRMTELGEIHEGRHRVRVLANEVIPEKSEGKKLSYEPVTQKINRFYEHRFMKEAKAALVRTQLKFIAGTIAAVVSGVYAYFYYYGETSKQTLSKTASDIGKGALSDEELLKMAEKMSKNIVHGVLVDDYIRGEVTRLLSNVVQSEQVLASSKVLVQNILADKNVQKSIGTLLYDQLLISINHPTIRENLTNLVLQVLSKEEISEKLQSTTRDLLNSDQVTQTVKTVLGDAIVTNYVKSQARRLAKDTTNSVINDPQVQANLSAAIYGAITPSLFSRKKSTPVISASEKSTSLVEEERDSIREQFDSSQGVEIDPDDVYP